ncbi:MAG: DUF2459 domain-containing protein, partial [Lentisphaeria bacterium]|nr:DUF2459 domain-containing protein [Lentisphaeria bacterium]
YFAHSQSITLKISSTGMTNLKKALLRSFKKEDGNVVKTIKGLYGKSLFFKGRGRYYMTNTCNTWTAKMIRKTGAPVSPFLTLSSGSVMKKKESNNIHSY